MRLGCQCGLELGSIVLRPMGVGCVVDDKLVASLSTFNFCFFGGRMNSDFFPFSFLPLLCLNQTANGKRKTKRKTETA
jgi:hypothetical protein